MKNQVKTKKRLVFAALFAVVTAIEVLIALFVHDDILRPFGGDVIVVWVVFFFVRIFFPDGLRLLPLWVFLFALSIEMLQYINFVELVGLSSSRFFCTVIGTSFSAVDIACYAAGCVPLAVYEILNYSKSRKNVQAYKKQS